ncbi:polyprenyl synthetase family protein [Oceanithermus sp.]
MNQLAEEIRKFIEEALPSPEAEPRPELAQYAELLRDYPSRGGKMLRGRLVILTARAYGDDSAALPVAAALELFQNWVLIHDDIEDDSEERRGRPALHRLYPPSLALNAGDALHAAMWRVLVEAGARRKVMAEFAQLIEVTASGQHLDLAWVAGGRFDLTPDDYLEMAERKAAYYTGVAPLRLGALAAGRLPHPAFATAGLELGVAFQIIDDVLNLEGDPGAYGKEIAGDLWEGKRTLILIDYLGSAPAPERARAEEILRKPRAAKEADEVAWLHERILESGAVARARELAGRKAAGALAELEEAFATLPDRQAAAEALDLLRKLVERQS